MKILLLAALMAFAERQLVGAQPGESKEPETGARILLLSKIPNPSAGVIYFTQPCITPDSRYALVRYLEPKRGHTAGYMYRYDFTSGELTKLTDFLTKNQVLVPASGNLYYSSGGEKADRSIYVSNIKDLKTRKVADMPGDTFCAAGLTVNANETMVACIAELGVPQSASSLPPNRGSQFTNKFNRHDTNLLLVADIKTRKIAELQRVATWLGHPQFSPTDPNLLMYCHEGPWAQVDRIWTIRLGDNSDPRLILKRTEKNEIAGHEFWSSNGKMIFFDHDFLNTPGKHFLEGKSVVDAKTIRHPIHKLFQSIHYTQSPDGKFFVCDGGSRRNPKDQGIFILVPQSSGELTAIKLCSMAHHDYKAAEPNPHLTPDQHWVLFTATFTGTPQAYAVEMPKHFWK